MTIRRKDSMSSISPRKLTPKEVRGKIVEEILNTETAYVQHLEDIVEVSIDRTREGACKECMCLRNTKGNSSSPWEQFGGSDNIGGGGN